jgi:hypothetical protein
VKRRVHVREPGLDWTIILKWILEEQVVEVVTGLNLFRIVHNGGVL